MRRPAIKAPLYAALAMMLTFFVTTSVIAALPKLQEKLGARNLEILKNAKYVTILTMPPKGTEHRYPPIQEVHLNHHEMERLKKNLLDDHNYDFGRHKQCLFLPEISFKFQDGNEQSLHVFVSPSCNQILFGADSHTVLLNYDPAHVRLEKYFQDLVTETRAKNKPTYR